MSHKRPILTLETPEQIVPEKRSTIRLKEPVVATQPRIKGKLEVYIKINELPNWVETLDNKKQKVCINAGGQIVQVELRPKIWNKLNTTRKAGGLLM